MAHQHVLLQHLVGTFGCYRAALQLRVQKSACRAQQAQLQRAQLSLRRLVRLHDVLGVQSPALGVGRVEGVERAREAHTLLHHRVELQFVARTSLVRGERPGDRIEGEIVVVVLGAAVRRGNVERQDELAALTGVVQQRRWHHVRRRLLRGLGGARETNDRRPIR